ncbi:MAG: hypothetical protein SGILL_003104 [Bacillariaceae sp.]
MMSGAENLAMDNVSNHVEVLPSSKEGHLSPRSPLDGPFEDGANNESPANGKGSPAIRKGVSFAPPEQKQTEDCSACDAPNVPSTAPKPRIYGSLNAEQAPVSPAPTAPTVTAAKPVSPTKANTKPKKVQWAKRVKVKEIRHLDDVSEAERQSLWMSFEDHQMAKAMVKTTVTMMMRGERIGEDDPDFCTRGLEFRTRTGSKIRSRYKVRGRMAVLNEQDIQRDEGLVDEEFIAMASLEVSNECRAAALQRGQADARAVQKFLEDVRLDVCGIR